MTGTPVTPDPKRLVSGPCWNLHLRCQLFESLSSCCCHDVPLEQHLDSQCILVCRGISVFQACVAVNIKTGDMFLRITQSESVPALVAL